MARQEIEPPSAGDIFRPLGKDTGRIIRGPRILLLLHDDCARCDAWVRDELDDVEDHVHRWDARVVRLGSDFSANAPGAAWIAVTDEWDEVYHVTHIGSDHTFPDPADLVEWARFVSIQCPECEGPEGPWRR